MLCVISYIHLIFCVTGMLQLSEEFEVELYIPKSELYFCLCSTVTDFYLFHRYSHSDQSHIGNYTLNTLLRKIIITSVLLKQGRTVFSFRYLRDMAWLWDLVRGSCLVTTNLYEKTTTKPTNKQTKPLKTALEFILKYISLEVEISAVFQVRFR